MGQLVGVGVGMEGHAVLVIANGVVIGAHPRGRDSARPGQPGVIVWAGFKGEDPCVRESVLEGNGISPVVGARVHDHGGKASQVLLHPLQAEGAHSLASIGSKPGSGGNTAGNTLPVWSSLCRSLIVVSTRVGMPLDRQSQSNQ